MIQQVLRAYSESKLLSDVAKLTRLGWSTTGATYKEGLFWYQAVSKQ
jgi:hypothetical protein